MKLLYKAGIVLVILILTAGSLSYFKSKTGTGFSRSREAAKTNYYLKIGAGPENKIASNAKTALELTRQNAEIDLKGSGANAYITAINGRKADEKKKEYWALFVNGKMGETGAGSYFLKKGDKIEWRIESF